MRDMDRATYEALMASYRHEVNQEETKTLCGLVPEDIDDGIPIACGCGHPDCRLPVTCPACKAVKTGQVN